MNRSIHKLKLHLMVAIIIMVPEAKAAVESYCSHVYIQAWLTIWMFSAKVVIKKNKHFEQWLLICCSYISTGVISLQKLRTAMGKTHECPLLDRWYKANWGISSVGLGSFQHEMKLIFWSIIFSVWQPLQRLEVHTEWDICSHKNQKPVVLNWRTPPRLENKLMKLLNRVSCKINDQHFLSK